MESWILMNTGESEGETETVRKWIEEEREIEWVWRVYVDCTPTSVLFSFFFCLWLLNTKMLKFWTICFCIWTWPVLEFDSNESVYIWGKRAQLSRPIKPICFQEYCMWNFVFILQHLVHQNVVLVINCWDRNETYWYMHACMCAI